MTYREKLAMEHPSAIQDNCWGGCKGCPGTYWEGAPTSIYNQCPFPEEAGHRSCTICWDSEIPETEPTKNTIHEKGEKEMEPRNISLSPTTTAAREPKKPSIRENMSELRDILTDIDCKTEELYHFLFGGECHEALHATPSCLEEDVQMTKELAMAIMNKIVMIQGQL